MLKSSQLEIVVLLNFLKSGLSTRKLDMLLGYKSTRGWKSWHILKKYGLKNEDKGKLFAYSGVQSKILIKKLMANSLPGLSTLIKNFPPKQLEKYHNAYVITDSEKKLNAIMSGETRNIIQGFFYPKKKIINKCQFQKCRSKKTLDTVHFMHDRPEIFRKCAKKFKISLKKGLFKYDLYKIMSCFLHEHNKEKSICFLCKKHHNEFHKAEKINKKILNSFKKKIVF